MDNSLSQLVRVSGTVRNVLYRNDENGYAVCDIEDEDGKLFTANGNMPYIAVGEAVDIQGKWTNHKVYGTQLSVEKIDKILPNSKDEILRYLSSGAIKGIGPKIAMKIVEKYGEDSFEVISEHPSWLSEIKGISLTKAREISEDFKEKSIVREILMFASDRFTPAMALKIYQKWGKDSLAIIRGNPYLLAENFDGIGFKKADEIAAGWGIEKDNEDRIKGALLYALRIFASRDGHTYVTKDTLVTATSMLIGVPIEKILPQIDSLGVLDKIKIVDYKDECHIYIKKNYCAEEYIAKKLIQLRNTAVSLDYRNSEAFIEQIEEQNGIKYAKMQKRAIIEALMNGVTVLTGGPGTGKTTVIKALIQIFDKIGFKCALCAPTGRASQRMSEATSHEAYTVHRLLEILAIADVDFETTFVKNEYNHLSENVIIVDETSMLDIHLAEALLKAIKPGSRLILIGDTHQLPSVGEGNVLNDVIESGAFPVVELNEIFRQSEKSGIVVNAYEINNGRIPDLTKKYDDFFFISIPDEELIPAYISELCKKRLPRKYGVDPVKDIQVITPTKKGSNGTLSLNKTLQELLNPMMGSGEELPLGFTRKLREGDKLMHTRNNYDLEWERYGEKGKGIFNGDVGIVKKIYSEEKKMEVDFEGKLTTYSEIALDEVEHAYAITVHKSQGSEYPIVIIPMTTAAPMLLTRNLIYTAITRAERMVILLGDKDIFVRMVENDRQIVRHTGLRLFLRSNENEAS